ncbi:RyR domain-containing protein [Nocardia sp. NPDC004722]
MCLAAPAARSSRIMASYRPVPLDISAVTLTAELCSLVELLAENAHDTWASMRIAEGWRYGSERSGHALLHPCIVPYSSLSEGEREYDRKMVDSTVRAILLLGFEIRRSV